MTVYLSKNLIEEGANHIMKQPTKAASKPLASKTPKKNTFWELLQKFTDAKLLFGVVALLVTLYAFVFHRADVEIGFNKEGVTIITRGNQVRKAIVLLPANKPWVNTGLDVVKGQKVTLTASGSVNLAFHRLVDSAQTHERPRIGWLGPEGGQHPYQTPLDNARSKYLIAPNPNNYGTVLACVVPDTQPAPGIENPSPEGTLPIGQGGSFTAVADGKLWLVVNDIILNEGAQEAYVAEQPVLDMVYKTSKVTVEQKQREWDRIKQDRYFGLFFDDNIGEFLIQVDFTK
jgi:hypothetical protein